MSDDDRPTIEVDVYFNSSEVIEAMKQPANDDRICITGGPRTGKTTFAVALGKLSNVGVSHTDDTRFAASWSEQSDLVASWLDVDGPWIIEGVAVPRALRKWLAAHPWDSATYPAPRPCDVVYWLHKTVAERSKGQATMAKAVETVWREVVDELQRRGVEVRIVDAMTVAA
jgi:adenylate kinase family enzyme